MKATTTVLPRGAHVVIANIERLSCLLRQDTTVGDRKYVELTPNNVYSNLILSGSPRERFLVLGVFLAG